MKLWLSLTGSLVVAVMLVAGVSALSGEAPAPAVRGPTPNFTPPPPPPGSTVPPVPISSSSVSEPALTVNGVPIYLPDGAQMTGPPIGSSPPYTLEVQIGDSWVRYSMPSGILLEQGVKATDEAAFRPLIDALKKPIVDDIAGALQIFAPYLPTLALPESINYVETTAGQANVLFEPARVWGVPADAPVWAILARGKLKEVDERIPPPVPTVWVIVTKGVPGAIFVGTDDRVPFGGIDMTKLGTVVSISLSAVPKP